MTEQQQAQARLIIRQARDSGMDIDAAFVTRGMVRWHPDIDAEHVTTFARAEIQPPDLVERIRAIRPWYSLDDIRVFVAGWYGQHAPETDESEIDRIAAEEWDHYIDATETAPAPEPAPAPETRGNLALFPSPAPDASAPAGTNLADVHPTPPEELVPGLAWMRRVTIISGRGGVGKSSLIRQICAGLACGDYDGHGHRILWVGEETADDLALAFDDVLAERDPARGLIRHYDHSEIPTREVLDKVIDDWHPSLIVVDPLYDLLRLETEISYVETRVAMKRWLHGLAPAAICLHHHVKDAQGRDSISPYHGSSGLEGSFTGALMDFAPGQGADLSDTRRVLAVARTRGLSGVRRGDVHHMDFDGRRYVRAGSVKLLPPTTRAKAKQPEIDRVVNGARSLRAAGLSMNAALRDLRISKGRGAKWTAFRAAWNEGE